MRFVLCFLVAFLFVNDANAQKVRAGWFVANDYLEESEEVNEPVGDDEQNVEDVSKTTVDEETVSITEEEFAFDKNRFALRNKDLNLASRWLKYALKNDDSHNIVLSPLSMYSTSLLLANGVVDEALFDFSSLFSVMRLKDVNDRIAKYMQTKEGVYEVHNSLWGKSFSEHYQKQMKELFGIEVWGLQGTAEPINNWINVRSKGLVSKVVPALETRNDDIFAISYIYFNGELELPFDVKQTKEREFKSLDGQKSSALMMNRKKAMVDYFEDSQMQAIRLFYKTGDYITFFLPKEGIDFSSFVENLDAKKLKPRFEKTEIDLSVPKLDIAYVFSQSKDMYKTLGISRIFERGNHDFAKMVSYDVSLHIEDVCLSAKFVLEEAKQVKEENDENQSNGKFGSKNTSFKADRPFVFMVNNGDFVGSYVKGEPILED